MAPCVSLSAINTILSLGIIFCGYIFAKEIRVFIKDNKWIIWLVIILVLSGTIQIKMNCP